MNIKDLVNKNISWLKGSGLNSDIVVSSRIRLARNLPDFSFKNSANGVQEKQVQEILKSAFGKINILKNAYYFDLKTAEPLEKVFLVERHLISKEHAEYTGYHSVMVSQDESISVMFNEEDHVRLQVLFPGSQLLDCWRIANKIDEEVEKIIKFAFIKEWGYLTSCPTNVGTGLRASVMVHLPCLVLTKQINKMLEAIAKLGLAVRGLYGEGTSAAGDFFQISNQMTLGFREEELIDNIERICQQVIQHEMDSRQKLYQKEKVKLEDRVWRAYGLLKNARILNYNEAIDLFSAIRLGLSLGILKEPTRQILNELFLITQPAHIQFLSGEKLSPMERDVNRAILIRDKIDRKK